MEIKKKNTRTFHHFRTSVDSPTRHLRPFQWSGGQKDPRNRATQCLPPAMWMFETQKTERKSEPRNGLNQTIAGKSGEAPTKGLSGFNLQMVRSRKRKVSVFKPMARLSQQFLIGSQNSSQNPQLVTFKSYRLNSPKLEIPAGFQEKISGFLHNTIRIANFAHHQDF